MYLASRSAPDGRIRDPVPTIGRTSEAGKGRANALSQEIFERGGEVGFFVAVLDDYRGVSAEAHLPAIARGDGAGAGNDNRALGDDERGLGGGAQHRAVD